MKRTLQEKIERNIQAIKEERVANILGVIDVVGIMATVYCLLQYSSGIIKFRSVVVVHALIGLIAGSLTYRYKKKKRKTEFRPLLHFFWAAVVYGEISMAAFLFTNCFFSTKTPVSKAYSIVERYDRHRSLPARVIIKIGDDDMEWTFSGKSINELNAATRLNSL